MAPKATDERSTAGHVHLWGGAVSKSGETSHGKRKPRNASSSASGIARQEPAAPPAIQVHRPTGDRRVRSSASAAPSPPPQWIQIAQTPAASSTGTQGTENESRGRSRPTRRSAASAAAMRAPYQRSREPLLQMLVTRAVARAARRGARYAATTGGNPPSSAVAAAPDRCSQGVRSAMATLPSAMAVNRIQPSLEWSPPNARSLLPDAPTI